MAGAKEQFLAGGKISSCQVLGEGRGEVIPTARLPAQGQLGGPTLQTRGLPQPSLGIH